MVDSLPIVYREAQPILELINPVIDKVAEEIARERPPASIAEWLELHRRARRDTLTLLVDLADCEPTLERLAAIRNRLSESR